MATRVTQNATEVLVSATPLARVTQNATEALVSATPLVRVTQNATEVLVAGANALVTQVSAEVLDQSSILNARVTQISAEVLEQPDISLVNARVTQISVEVLRHTRRVTETFTANAWLRAPRSGFANLDAVLKKTINPTGKTVNAYINKPIFADFTADAVVGPGFWINAVLKKTRSSSFLASAVLIGHLGYFSANAYIAQRFHADASIRKTVTHTFTADAIYGHFLRADAAIRRTTGKSFTVDARFLRHSFTASAVIAPIAAGQPGGPPAGTVLPLSIKVNGLDITADVEIATATFTQAVNARPGEFSFEVKDDEHIYQFVSGGRVTCDIDGHRLFDGYVNRATMHYAFPVDLVVDPATTPRLWKLEGPDLNILFQKRFIYDQVNPNADLPTFAANTSDKTIIMTYINEYLDLHGDEITTDGVQAVGTSNPDDIYTDHRGSSWGVAMGQVAQLTGAVWGLTQDRDLFYEDANTESAPFRLSDTPNNTTTIGYSNFQWTDDGTKLVNDAQVWGAGTGSTVKVYSEVEDATSIADHGRWQLPGQFRGDMFRQTTVDHVAHSIVYGSEQNLHGGKDPLVLVNCRIKRHGLRAGMKVRVVNSVFGLDMVLPIRRMTMTFVNKDDVLYDLVLTREIDEPWFFAEFAGYPYDPHFGGGIFVPPRPCPPGQIRVGGKCVSIPIHPPLPGCSDEVCGVTDSFDRLPDAFGWGRSDVGADWKLTTSGYGIAKTDGARGLLTAVRGQPCGMELVGVALTAPIDVRFDFLISAIKNVPLDKLTFSIGGAIIKIDYGSSNHSFEGSGTELWVGEADTANSNAMKHSYIAGVTHHVHLTFTPNSSINDRPPNGLITVSVWPEGATEPVTPELSVLSEHSLQVINPTFEVSSTNPPPLSDGGVPRSYTPESPQPSANGPTIYIDNFDIAGRNRCDNVQFDDFNRTVASGLGTSTYGIPWTNVSVIGSGTWGVSGSSLYATGNATNGRGVRASIVGFPGIASDFVMSTRFQMTRIPLASDVDSQVVFHVFDSVGGQGADVTLQLMSNSPYSYLEYTEWSDDGATTVFTQRQHVNEGVDGRWYVLEWDTAYGVRVYIEGNLTPTWDIPHVLPVVARDTFRITPQSTKTSTLNIDSIDFDYAGKPCYISCPAPDYTVYPEGWTGWDIPPAVYCAVIEGVSGNQRTCISDGVFNGVGADAFSMVYLYGGATYVVSYDVVHSYDSMTLYPTLFEAGRTGLQQWSVNAGSAADCWLWPVPNENPATQPLSEVKVWDTAYRSNWFGAVLNSSMCCCGTNYGSSMTGWVRYVSGPDPRFQNLAAQPCVPISSAVGQPAAQAGASGSQVADRVSATEYKLWVPYIPGTLKVWLNGRILRPTYDYTEYPAHATVYFVLPVGANDVVYITYLAAGSGEPVQWQAGGV